jgi:hypothetical protein
MNVIEAALRGIASDLDRQRQPWALVGGFAVSVRAEPRFTRDVDVAAAVSGDDAAEALVRSLFECGYRLLASVENHATGRLATAPKPWPTISMLEIALPLGRHNLTTCSCWPPARRPPVLLNLLSYAPFRA